MTDKELVELALEARKRAYTPYSHWAVGAALLDKQGKVWLGCNIENAAYTPCNCAERTAFFKAISEGVLGFEAIAVVGGPQGKPTHDYCAPCGVCRQVMREFCDKESFRIILGADDKEPKSVLLKDLLPHDFGPEDLGFSIPEGA